jgi:hypothetical protein
MRDGVCIAVALPLVEISTLLGKGKEKMICLRKEMN